MSGSDQIDISLGYQRVDDDINAERLILYDGRLII